MQAALDLRVALLGPDAPATLQLRQAVDAYFP